MKTVPCRASHRASPHSVSSDQVIPRGWETPVSGSRHSSGRAERQYVREAETEEVNIPGLSLPSPMATEARLVARLVISRPDNRQVLAGMLCCCLGVLVCSVLGLRIN